MQKYLPLIISAAIAAFGTTVPVIQDAIADNPTVTAILAAVGMAINALVASPVQKSGPKYGQPK
jgi:hypothetical protein